VGLLFLPESDERQACGQDKDESEDVGIKNEIFQNVVFLKGNRGTGNTITGGEPSGKFRGD
jgi:hypothetical protein